MVSAAVQVCYCENVKILIHFSMALNLLLTILYMLAE